VLIEDLLSRVVSFFPSFLLSFFVFHLRLLAIETHMQTVEGTPKSNSEGSDLAAGVDQKVEERQRKEERGKEGRTDSFGRG